MAINIKDDDLAPARALLKAKLGRRISPGTLWRWHRKGTRGCRLDCVMVGGMLHTTPAAVADFIRGQNPDRDEQQHTAPAARQSRSLRRRLKEEDLVK
jgi:hypothetical protein